MKNGDRIRNMSDEELAVTLMCPNEMGMADIDCSYSDASNCFKCLLNWLQTDDKKEAGGATQTSQESQGESSHQ